MRHTLPIHVGLLREIDSLALQSKYQLERLQWRVAGALRKPELADPINAEELDVLCERTATLAKRLKELRDSVRNEHRPEAVPA